MRHRRIQAYLPILEDKRTFEHPRKDYVVMQLEMILVGRNFLHQMNSFLKMGDGPSAVLDMDPDSSFLYSVLQLGKKLHDLAAHSSKSAALQSRDSAFSAGSQDAAAAWVLEMDVSAKAFELLNFTPFAECVSLRGTRFEEEVVALAKRTEKLTKGFSSPGQTSWKHELAADASLKDVLAKAKATIDTLDGSMVMKQIDSLKEARHQLTGLAGRPISLTTCSCSSKRNKLLICPETRCRK